MKNLLILLFLVACWQMGYAQPISFTEQTIGFASNSLSVGHADLNNDGHMDLVSAEAVSGVLYWWKNDGLVNPSFTRIQFEGNFAQANNFVFADLNGDGTIDIINSSFTQGEVAAWLNNGEPDTPTFTKKVIKSGFASALGVAVGDLDKDGDIDVAASAQFSGAGKVIVRWNDGNLDPAFSETTLGSLASINRRALVVADYNKDGKQDVITANDGANQVKFFRNLGGQVFQQRTILSARSQNYHAAFMNDDFDDLDVLVLDQSSPATIQYYRNSGLYNPNNTNPNFSIRSVGGPVGSGSEIYPADLDNDGNMDVICASTLGPKALQWYESGGGANPSFTSYTINADPGYFGAYSYQAADLDGDGDLDIYGGEFSKMVWYENDLLEPLEITCPNDITVNTDQGECSANITVPLATVTGGCGNETINDSENGTGDASGSYDRGDNIVVYTVVDDCGNTKNCTTTITVNDNEGPQLVCRNQTIELMGFPPFDSPFTFDASDVTSVAVDNCDPETFVSAVPASISCADVGSIVEVLVTWRDNSFNETTCTAFITVEDGRGPNVLCNDPVVALGDNGEYTLTEADVLSDASSDNCGTVNFVSASPSVVDCDDVGSTIAVTVTANDGNGNTRTCTANVTVEDNEGPNLVCRNQTISLGSFPFSSPYTFSASDVTSIANGSCGNIFVGAVPAGISCADVGSTVEVLVTWRDVNFNESTCTAFITVEDGDPPFVLCNDPVVALGANGEYELTGSDVLSDASSDNCGTVNFESASPSIVDCDDIGSTVAVTVFVNDGNGNRRPCTANVTISSVAPVVPTPETLTRVRCRRETATITVADPGTDLEVVWRVLEAPAGVSFAAGDELEANVNGSDYRTDLDANGRQLRTKGQARAGIYRFQAFTRNVNTGCEGALTTEEFMITINELPAMPTADITTDAGCVGQSSGEVSVVDPGAGFTVSWEVLEAPAGATFAAEDILASNTADSHYRTNQNMNGSLLRIKSNNSVTPGTYRFQAFLTNTVTGCVGDPTTEEFVIEMEERPAIPVAASATNEFCKTTDLSPSLPNTGVNVSNNISANEQVVWVLTSKPSASAYMIGDEFTTDDCSDPFNNFGELAVANFSKVIRVQDVANAPIGTYTFDAFIVNCVTGCSSELVSGFSITVYDTPAIPTVNRLERAACVGATATVSVLDPADGLEINWEVVAAPIGASFTAGDVLEANVDAIDYRTDVPNDTNGKRLRVKANNNVAVGTYQFRAKAVNPATGCESALTNEVFEINIYPQPTVAISADPDGDLCQNIMGVQYEALITSTDGGTYTYDWCAYNSGDGSGTCFGGFDDNTLPNPVRSWTGSTGPKSVGVSVESDINGCSAEDLYSFEVVAPTVLACPSNQTITLVTNSGDFNCNATAMWNHPSVESGVCDPVMLTISIAGEEAETVTPGAAYSADFDALGTYEVVYQLEDAVGNTSTCSFMIAVDGLPCGWVDHGGLGCSSSTSMFDQAAATYSLSTGCAPQTGFNLEDASAFVFTELCGDGEIIAQVNSIEGNGFAGLMLRETEAAIAKKIALGTNTINRLRREVRVLDGYLSSASPITSFGQFWIRITRSGDTFSAFASSDGIFWQPYILQTIIMGECVLAGLYTYTEKSGNPVEATFSDVFVSGLANLPSNLGAPIAIRLLQFI